MDHVINSTTLTFRRGKLFVFLLRVGILGMIMLRSTTVSSEDGQIGVPDTGLLCISDCATCPAICSPPPPKQSYTPISPPISHHSPPQSYYHSPPPPPAPSPPLPPPPQKSEPPSSSYWDTPPPPPPFKYNNNMPPGQGPPIPGPRDYPYPYYYFYASKASFLPSHAPILLVTLFNCVVLFFC